MGFKCWLERTLYHGTVIDNEPSIRQIGLVGQVGKFVSNAYGGEGIEWQDEDEIVYLADKKGLKGALTAMVFQVGKKLGKNLHDVSDNDIINHGLLLKIHDPEGETPQRPRDDDYGGHPQAVEPGDYYTPHVYVDEFIKGKAILRLLKRYGLWPRDWGEASPSRQKEIEGELIKRVIAAHPERSKDEVIRKVKSLTPEQKQEFLRRYR